MMPSGRALRVLVVDDNRDAADSLAMLCKMWGYEVRSAYNGSAINMVPVFKPDVIVLDIAMPKMDGNKMAKQVREDDAHKETLIIAVSGYHDDANRMLSKQAGIDHYLIKPVDPSVLEKLLLMKDVATRLAEHQP
jgi:two-component system CheB/CheR fusion protein